MAGTLKDSVFRRLAWSALAAATGVSAAVGVTSPAEAVANCSGDGTYLSSVELRDDGAGNFIIVATPTAEARAQSAVYPSQRGAVVEEWHAIQACVPGLYGNLADSIWQQLECHQRWAWALRPDGEWATGPTYDLESWRPKLEDDNFFAKSASKCGGYLGVEPDGEFSNPYRPDAGVTDLEHAFDNYG